LSFLFPKLTPSHLSSPLSAISSILLIDTTTPTSLVALSLQAAAKVFGTYAADISTRWTAELHTECKNVVASVRSGLEPFLSSPDIEAQERAFEFTQLLSFVSADLANHVPPAKRPERIRIPGMDGGFEDADEESGSGSGTDQPPYPKSLFLFQPLFTSHELNALAPMAQAAVPLPEGLNLDMDIVPYAGFGALADDADSADEEGDAELDLGTGGGAGMDELRRVLREQEQKKKKKKLSPEDKAERAKVSASVRRCEATLTI
jgi:AP-3 complex subunit delta-1